MSGLSLWDIESALTELLEAHAELTDPAAEHGPDIAAEIAEVEKAIAEYVGREISKVDGIHSFLRYAKATAAQAREEAAAMTERARRLEAAEARIKQIACDVMAARGLKRLEGTAGRYLSRRGNGGVAPLVIQADVLPDEWRDVTVALPLLVWREMLRMWTDQHMERPPSHACEPTPANQRIRIGLTVQPLPGAHFGERGEHVEVR